MDGSQVICYGPYNPKSITICDVAVSGLLSFLGSVGLWSSHHEVLEAWVRREMVVDAEHASVFPFDRGQKTIPDQVKLNVTPTVEESSNLVSDSKLHSPYYWLGDEVTR